MTWTLTFDDIPPGPNVTNDTIMTSRSGTIVSNRINNPGQCVNTAGFADTEVKSMSGPQSISFPFAEDSDILSWPTRVARKNVRVAAVILGDPLSKQRPRFAMNKRGSVYTPTTTKEAEQSIGLQIMASHRALLPDDTSAFAVRLFFRTKTYQRRDIDNMTKLVFDACTGIVWKDDSQVVEITARLIRGDVEPRTELVITSLGAMSPPMTACQVCGKKFRTYPSWNGKPYCSRQCMKLGFRTGQNAPCIYCGVEVYRPLSLVENGVRKFFCSQACRTLHTTVDVICAVCSKTFSLPQSLAKRARYCSELCRAEAAKVQGIRSQKNAYGICIDCGGPTSKRAYQRCRSCSIKAGALHLGGKVVKK